MQTNKSTTKSFSILTLITLFEKVIAFVYEAIIAATLGASLITDAYFTSAEFYSLVDTAWVSSLTVVALNRFTHHLNAEGEKKAYSSLSNLLSCYFPIILAVAGMILVLASPISYLIAPGYNYETRQVLIRCIRVMTVIPPTLCIISVELAVLQQKKHFGITGLKSLFISVVGIFSLLLFGHKDVKNADVLSVAYVLSIILYGVLIVYCVSKYGKVCFCKPKFNSEIKKTLFMLLPLMVSYGVTNLALMVGKVISSGLGEGYVSSLTYAHSLYRVVTTVFVANLAIILLTDFNELFAQKQYDAIANKFSSVVSIMTVVLLPITIISMVCSRDVVKIVYERGSFTPETTRLVGSVLMVYAINFIPAMTHSLYNQVMYGKGDTKSPMWIALISIAMNVAVSLALVNVLGLCAVAVGTVASTITSVVICRFVVKKHLPTFRGCYSARFVISCIISGVVCFCATFLVKKLALPALLTFILATAAGGASFGGMMLLLREQVTVGLMQKAISILKRKK